MVEIRFVNADGKQERIESTSWVQARLLGKSLAMQGCTQVVLTTIRRDLYVVDPETLNHELVKADVPLSRVGDMAGWWCDQYRDYGLLLLPAKRESRPRRLA